MTHGVNFTSTVDDSGTAGVAAQATTQGNGDGDAGDNDSWKVTTTNGAGGACPINVFIADENPKFVESPREKLDLYRTKSYFMYAQ